MQICFYETFKKLCIEREKTEYEVLSLLGIEEKELGYWRIGILPSTDVLDVISNYFGVSSTYLLYGRYEDLTAEEAIEVVGQEIAMVTILSAPYEAQDKPKGKEQEKTERKAKPKRSKYGEMIDQQVYEAIKESIAYEEIRPSKLKRERLFNAGRELNTANGLLGLKRNKR